MNLTPAVMRAAESPVAISVISSNRFLAAGSSRVHRFASPRKKAQTIT